MVESQWLRLWLPVTWCCFILWLCAGCSDANVARHSGEYRLDINATEGRSPGSRELFDNVVLTLNSDGSFKLAGKFAGVSRTDKGMWSIAGATITLRFTHVGGREERFAKVADIDDHRLTFETRVRKSDVTAVFLRDTFPAWAMSILAVVMLVAVWLGYAHRENPSVTFTGGSPAFVTAAITVFCLAMFIVGIVGSFKPEVVVWATEATDTFSTLEYLGFLALLAVGIIALAAEEGGGKNALWAVFGLGAIALLVWLYFRFGVEFKVKSP